MLLCGLCDVEPVLSGNTAPVKHPQLIAVVRKPRLSERLAYTLRVQLPCLGRGFFEEAMVTLNPAVAGFRKGEK